MARCCLQCTEGRFAQNKEPDLKPDIAAPGQDGATAGPPIGSVPAPAAESPDQVALFDSDGRPVAYVDVEDDRTISLWGGKPVAYLAVSHNDSRDVTYNIFGFNGYHLGWYEGGIIKDHKGYSVGFVNGAISKPTTAEGPKGLKQLKPLKKLEKSPPMKPPDRPGFASTPLSLLLAGGRE